MSKPLLSIGIIFKNDLRCIERCLKSLQPLRDRKSVVEGTSVALQV